MADYLALKAAEEGSYVMNVRFYTLAGTTAAPKTLTWTLTDSSGTVINARQDVNVAAPAADQDILLSGDDLQVLAGETDDYLIRVFLIEGTFDDADLGNDLPFKKEVRFLLENLVDVS